MAQLRQRQRQRQQQEDEEQIRQRQRQHEDGRVQREDEIFRALLAQAQQHGLLGTHPPTGHRPLPPDAELPDFAEVMQASQEAIRNARRSCEQWLRRNIPEKWQRRFSVWLLHAKVASPNLKLMLQRGWRRIAAVFGLPDSLPDLPSKIPTPLLISLALMYLRFPGALLKHLLGLAYLSFVASLLIWEDCDICCETCSTAFMVKCHFVIYNMTYCRNSIIVTHTIYIHRSPTAAGTDAAGSHATKYCTEYTYIFHFIVISTYRCCEVADAAFRRFSKRSGRRR